MHAVGSQATAGSGEQRSQGSTAATSAGPGGVEPGEPPFASAAPRGSHSAIDGSYSAFANPGNAASQLAARRDERGRRGCAASHQRRTAADHARPRRGR